MPAVSIIVPVYNVEKYLDRCIRSLCEQTLKDIEIILVDDGSTDGSGDICDTCSGMDHRIKVIHKTNGGLSSARNAGLEEASGQYIGFVDSDDDVEPGMYEQMYQLANEYKVDFVMSDYVRIRKDGYRFLKTLDIPVGYYDKEKIKEIIYPNLIMGENLDYGPLLSVWHCLYRHDFLRENGLKFDNEIKWSEDNLFSSVAGYCCKSFYYLKGAGLYRYHQNENTITTSYRPGAWQVYHAMNSRIHQFFDSVEDYDFGRQMDLHIIYYACNCVNQESALTWKEAEKNIRMILEDQKLSAAFKSFKYPAVPFKLKMQLLLMKHKMASVLYILKKYT